MSTSPTPPADSTPPAGATRNPLASLPARPIALAGAVLLLIGCFLSWSYTSSVLGDLTLTGNPGAVQLQMLLVAVLALLLLFARTGPLAKLGAWLNPAAALHVLGLGSLAFMAAAVAFIAWRSGGLINVEPGGWVALLGAGLLALGAWGLAPTPPSKDTLHARVTAWIEILTIVVLMAILLFGAAYVLDIKDADTFLLTLICLGVLATALARAGFFSWVAVCAQNNRQVLMLGAFAVAFLFPFTQNGSDANMSIASQILIFAVTALGLNIVVGLAGLLDLGYIAFLGSGAYVGAMMSASAFATINWKPPFIVVMLIGGLVAGTLGLIIGSPTLRVSGDYLAIVTLAFGEIFRLAMGNLDGTNGPNLTHGPNGIPAIPNLKFGSFDFGQPHTVFGIELGRYSNYYFLLLVLAAIVITIFSRLNNSRIGRGWVAIREDERAAEAMGVNVFGLKLFAFASGAFLAGMAGTVKAHQDVSVTPEQYIFLESAFLLAAIVLGGMGTVAGVLIGATLLKLLPEKLRFVSEYRLLLFGLLLVLVMRFRPEGIVASKRRQLEFHEDDQNLADRIEEANIEQAEATA